MTTIYMGGGTPSHLSCRELERLLDIIRTNFSLAAEYEFSLEANPDSLTKEKIQILRDGGINRVSLGVQSFSPAVRAALGRQGSVHRVRQGVEALRNSGITNVNCDVIYGVPNQTLADWKTDLRKIAALQPTHVSAYTLTVEPGTPLAARGTTLLPEDDIIEMWTFADEYLADRCDIRRYEISNFARRGYECRHNSVIWKGARFLGAGPSACYFDGQSRWTNPPDLHKWMTGVAAERDFVSPVHRAIEILITGLRMVAGWERQEFKERTGFDYVELRGREITALADAGLLQGHGDGLRCTQRGLLLADYIARELL